MHQPRLCRQQAEVACRQEKAPNLAREPLHPLQHAVLLPSCCSFASCWGQEASGDVPSRGRALLPSRPVLPAPLSPGTAPIFPRQFGKQKVRASVCDELRSAFSSSSATPSAAGAREACSCLFLGWLPVGREMGPCSHLGASPGCHQRFDSAQLPLPRVSQAAGAAQWG